MSVTSIEAYLNELSDVIAIESAQLNERTIILHEKLLAAERNRESLERKVKLVYEYSGANYDPSRIPIQDFGLLIELRNSLTHYKTHNNHTDHQPIKLLGKLRSKRILLGRGNEFLSSPAYSWFHEICTKETASWALKTCLAIITSMSSNLEPSIENILTGCLALEVENA
ncbi:hypothetical protein HGP28_08395 [Vibrio sp. SM6]|uniref:Uncharacterized protein n=1 Tax=Vibrio agarilyticus TaxID=2726741 RepID=A0A7X8YH22_9VIBR|nr:hypothetical protein [Vibrio agarilyticus]NLS12907.1 hypothetical protein [Vibrio agarilyticus]